MACTVSEKWFHILGSEIYLIFLLICVGKKQKGECRNTVEFKKWNQMKFQDFGTLWNFMEESSKKRILHKS